MRHSYWTGSLFTNNRSRHPTHTHTRTHREINDPKDCWLMGGNVFNSSSTVIAVSQSRIATGSVRGWKSSPKHTITSGSLSAIDSIKISPWRSTDSQTGLWERERADQNKGKVERKPTYIQKSTQKKERNHWGTEGWSSAESHGRAQAAPAFRSPEWTPLNL